jgi:hypothetical protein
VGCPAIGGTPYRLEQPEFYQASHYSHM